MAETVGEIIARRRKELKLTQKQLAEIVGSHQQMIVKLEAGTLKFSRYIPLIEEALKLPANTLSSIALDADIGGRSPSMQIYKLSHHGSLKRCAPQRFAGLLVGCYGVEVTDKSLAPAYEPGDVLIVSPTMPVAKNRDHLFRGTSKSCPSMIARIVLIEPSSYRARKCEAAAQIEEYAKNLFTVHRIVGKYCA